MFAKLGKCAVSLAAALAVFISVPAAARVSPPEMPTDNVDHVPQGEDDDLSTHKLEGVWEGDDVYHWKWCSTPGCPGVENYGEHTFPEKYTLDGNTIKRECTVCGYEEVKEHTSCEVKPVVIPGNESKHKYQSTCSEHDTVDFHEENHSYVTTSYYEQDTAPVSATCDKCGYEHTHIWDNGLPEDGEIVFTCDACDSTYTKKAVVEPTEHTEHVDADADCKCDVCGEHVHHFIDEDFDDEQHCTYCANTDGRCTEPKVFEDHDYNTNGECKFCHHRHINHADSDSNGQCDICGAEVHVHNGGSDWQYDEAQHWLVCADDGEKYGAADHTYVTHESGTEYPDISEELTCTVCGQTHTHMFVGDTDLTCSCGATFTKTEPKPTPTPTPTPSYDDDDEDDEETSTPEPVNPVDPVENVASHTTAEVETDENTPHTAISTSTESLVSMIFTDEQLEDIGNADVAVTLNVKGDDKAIPTADVNVVEDVIKESDYTLGRYFDITLSAKVGGTETRITETNGNLTLVVDIPEELLGEGRTYFMLRIHDGQQTVLEDLDNDPGTITFKTDKFSTYALVYQDQAAEPSEPSDSTDSSSEPSVSESKPSDSNPGTGIIYSMIPVVLLAGGAAACAVLKKRSKK